MDPVGLIFLKSPKIKISGCDHNQFCSQLPHLLSENETMQWALIGNGYFGSMAECVSIKPRTVVRCSWEDTFGSLLHKLISIEHSVRKLSSETCPNTFNILMASSYDIILPPILTPPDGNTQSDIEIQYYSATLVHFHQCATFVVKVKKHLSRMKKPDSSSPVMQWCILFALYAWLKVKSLTARSLQTWPKNVKLLVKLLYQ